MIFEKQIQNAYRAQLFNRCDDTGNVFYFSAEDFEGLTKEPYTFVSSEGHRLRGYFYSYADFDSNRLVVFDHGYGGGHRAYMKEIEMLCRHGYRVFAYDHTGCMESGGESTGGFAHSLCDLNDCLCALKADEKYQNLPISVVGHSWGAFSCLNIAAFHPDVTHIVAISGFVSVEQMLKQNFGGLLALYRKGIYAIEKERNPKFVDRNAAETLSETDAKVLLIYSADDRLVKKQFHYELLKERLSSKENIEFLLVDGKGHNPNYTADAVRYKDEFFAVLTDKVKKKQLSSAEQKAEFVSGFDWNRMTAQDEEVWARIFACLDSAK